MIGVEQFDGFAFIILVGSSGNSPGLSVSIDKVNAGVDGLPFANDLQVNRRITVVIVDIDTSRDEAAKVFNLANFGFQAFIGLQKRPGRVRRLTTADRIKHYPDDAASKDDNDQSNDEDNRDENDENFLCSHGLSNLDTKIEVREIVE